MKADLINTLGNFLGVRDLAALTPAELKKSFGIGKADVCVLFGGSVLAGGDVFADAMRQGMAKKYIIVGGAGHTTGTLRQTVHMLYPDMETEGLPEAVIFQAYLKKTCGLAADFLETASTNCGNNITNLLALLAGEEIPCQSVIFIQDASMQRRMAATMRKYRPDMTVIGYAAYQAAVTEEGGGLSFAEEIKGMWTVERYVTLLMGEIPRLTDDENGYGPKGKGFIAHEEIPADVEAAFRALKEADQSLVRRADDRYAGN